MPRHPPCTRARWPGRPSAGRAANWPSAEGPRPRPPGPERFDEGWRVLLKVLNCLSLFDQLIFVFFSFCWILRTFFYKTVKLLSWMEDLSLSQIYNEMSNWNYIHKNDYSYLENEIGKSEFLIQWVILQPSRSVFSIVFPSMLLFSWQLMINDHASLTMTCCFLGKKRC